MLSLRAHVNTRTHTHTSCFFFVIKLSFVHDKSQNLICYCVASWRPQLCPCRLFRRLLCSALYQMQSETPRASHPVQGQPLFYDSLKVYYNREKAGRRAGCTAFVREGRNMQQESPHLLMIIFLLLSTANVQS